MENENNITEQITPTAEPEIVIAEPVTQTEAQTEAREIEQATDEELEAALNPSVEAPETTATQPVVEEAKEVVEQSVDFVKQDEVPEYEKISKKQYEDLKKQLYQQELFLKRRSSELGETRKELKGYKEKLEAGLDDQFITHPKEAMERALQLKEIEKELRSIDRQESHLTEMHKRQVIVAKHVKPEESDMTEMTACLQADGLDAQAIEAFKSNPWQAAQPETIIQLAKRAHATKVLKQLAVFAKSLIEENERLKTKPQELLNGVQKALKQPPQVVAAQGTSVRANPVKNITQWSAEEIDKYLANVQG